MDLSSIDNCESKQVRLIVKEDDLCNKDVYVWLYNEIDKMIGETYSDWRYDFVIVDSSNGESILSSNDLIRVLAVYKQTMNMNMNDNQVDSHILFKMKHLSAPKPNTKNKLEQHDVQEQFNKLKMFLRYWNNNEKFSLTLHNRDNEIDFIFENLHNIRQCIDIIENEGKSDEKLTNEQVMTDEDKIAMAKRFDHLLETLEMEDYYGGSVVHVNVCDAKRAALGGKWLLAVRKMRKILNDIKPFNIKKMLLLYDQTSTAAERIEGKDVCLLLGHTGACKSTKLHFLAGSQMKRDQNTGHIYPVNVKREELKRIARVQKVTESVTRFVSSATLNLRDAGVIQFGADVKNVIELCDTPGFNDTEGPEMDVSNGLGIVKAVSSSRSVKVLMVISKGDIDGRIAGLKDLADTVAKLIPKCGTYFKNKAIVPVFTHMQFTDGKTLKYLFDLGYKELEDKGDTDDMALMHIFNAVMKCRNPIVLDPLKSDRKDVLEQIFDLDNQWIKKQVIDFCSFVTSTSLDKIYQQILKHKADIARACSTIDKEMNFSVIDSKLYDMKRLTQVLPDSEKVSSSLKESMRYVADAWNERCENVMNPLRNTDYVNQRSVNDFKRDVEVYYRIMQESHQAQALRTKYFVKQNTHEDENGNLGYNLVSANALHETLSRTFNSLLNGLSLTQDSQDKWSKIDSILSKCETTFKLKQEVKCHYLDYV